MGASKRAGCIGWCLKLLKPNNVAQGCVGPLLVGVVLWILSGYAPREVVTFVGRCIVGVSRIVGGSQELPPLPPIPPPPPSPGPRPQSAPELVVSLRTFLGRERDDPKLVEALAHLGRHESPARDRWGFEVWQYPEGRFRLRFSSRRFIELEVRAPSEASWKSCFERLAHGLPLPATRAHVRSHFAGLADFVLEPGGDSDVLVGFDVRLTFSYRRAGGSSSEDRVAALAITADG